MDPILVDIAQLRTLMLPRITLTPGRVIMARVAEAGDGRRGELAIAGGRISATLPPGVRAGDELRLVVKDVSAERLVLQIETPAAAPRESVEEREAAGGGGRQGTPSQVLELRYATQNLGLVGLRFALHPGGAISVTVGMPDDAGITRARSAADGLRAAIAQATGADVGVSVTAQRPPLDVYV